MIEYNMNFLEACEFYSKGDCEAIESENECKYKSIDCGPLSHVLPNGSIKHGIGLSPLSFLGKWRVIPKPVKRKEVFEGVRWVQGAAGCIFPIAESGDSVWSKVLNKPGMKVTCEWVE